MSLKASFIDPTFYSFISDRFFTCFKKVATSVQILNLWSKWRGVGEIGLRMGNLVFNLMFMNITNSSDWCSTVLSLFLFGGRGWLREAEVSKETILMRPVLNLNVVGLLLGISNCQHKTISLRPTCTNVLKWKCLILFIKILITYPIFRWCDHYFVSSWACWLTPGEKRT